MPSEGSEPGVVIVRGDQAHCWKYAFVFMVGITIATPVVAIILVGELSSTTSALLDTLIFWCVCALAAMCHALWWCFIPGRTQYVCDGQTLKALRGGRVLKEVDCSTIRELHMASSLTWMNITPPNTPWMTADVEDPRGWPRGVSFPTILIWGRDPLVRAEAALAHTAGVQGKLHRNG